MIGDPVLGKVVGANLFTPVAAAHQRATGFGNFTLLLLQGFVVQA